MPARGVYWLAAPPAMAVPAAQCDDVSLKVLTGLSGLPRRRGAVLRHECHDDPIEPGRIVVRHRV